MAGYIPGLLPANHSQEKEFAQAYEDVLERYKGKRLTEASFCCVVYLGKTMYATVCVYAPALYLLFVVSCPRTLEVDGGSLFPLVCKRAEDI